MTSRHVAWIYSTGHSDKEPVEIGRDGYNGNNCEAWFDQKYIGQQDGFRCFIIRVEITKSLVENE